jgi:hypothetical protein
MNRSCNPVPYLIYKFITSVCDGARVHRYVQRRMPQQQKVVSQRTQLQLQCYQLTAPPASSRLSCPQPQWKPPLALFPITTYFGQNIRLSSTGGGRWVGKGETGLDRGGQWKLWCRLKSSVNPRKAPGFFGVSPQKKKKTSVNPKERNSGEIFVASSNYYTLSLTTYGQPPIRMGTKHSG